MSDTTSSLLLQLTRAAFALRLLAVAVAVMLLVGGTLTAFHLVAMVVLGTSSVLGLFRDDVMPRVARHPLLALLDLVMVAAVGGLARSASVFLLAMLSTAVLIGLWVDLWADLIILVVLMAVFAFQSLQRGVGVGQLVTMPFAYLALWYTAVCVRQAVDREARSAHLVRESIAAAAAAEERSRVAGELHDQVAKSIQGTALAASTLPRLIAADPMRALAVAEQTQDMATRAVVDLRQVMTGLRTETDHQPFGQALVGVVDVWEQRTGRTARVTVDPTLELGRGAVQYEVLAAVEELLDNVAAHAGACEVRVSAVVVERTLFVSVADTGRGIAPGRLSAARGAGHLGLDGVAARLLRVGGRAVVDSTPGEGTTVDLVVDLDQRVERSA